MQDNSFGKYTWSFGISVIVTSIFSALLVLLKESNPDTVLAWMKAPGHHWVTHGVLNLIVFFAVGFALANLGKASEVPRNTRNLIGGLVLSVLGSAVVIAGFFLLEG